jgi:hypothetical protein
VHPRLTENLTLTDLLNQNATTNFCPLFHVCVHPPSQITVGKDNPFPRS